jgi:hypothetical protein
MAAIIAAQASVAFTVDILAKLVDRLMIDGTDTANEETEWTVIVGVLIYEERIYVPVIDFLHGNVISLLHDNPESGHFGALKTTELVSRDIYWPVMDSCVRKYVCSCKVYH